MQRVIVICEGQTEVEFCKQLLVPYFSGKAIFIYTPLIKKSGGGIVPWSSLKKQIERHLTQDRLAYVSLFVDYYGITAKFNFPGWETAHKEVDKSKRMEILENEMKRDINITLQSRFIPYLQLHEFEGLLFNNLEAFEATIPESDFLDKRELRDVLEKFPNPELINDTPENAPSFRLKRCLKGYNKIVYGAMLAEQIGLKKIMDKSPRFNAWIRKVELVREMF